MVVKLKADLHDKKIIVLCDRIYRDIKPEDENCDTYIEYRLISDSDVLFAGNINLAEKYIVQVDIFSYGSNRKLSEIIKLVLKSKGYIYLPNGLNTYEEDTKLYHRAMRFKYTMFKNN